MIMHKALKNVKNLIVKLGTRAVDIILPPRCIITGHYVDNQGMISPEAWSELSFITTPFCTACGIPLAFEVAKGTICASCAQTAPPFDKARSALIYNDDSKSIILRFKHADQTHAVHSFTPWLMRAGHEFMDDSEIIVPVPLHRYRLLKRRYNQAALIGHALARQTGISCIPDMLCRQRPTPSQGHLKFGERRKNVKNAFAVNPYHKQALKGRSVLLIDDVYTTGATIKECTKTLKKNGAGKVYVLTLARVVRSDILR